MDLVILFFNLIFVAVWTFVGTLMVQSWVKTEQRKFLDLFFLTQENVEHAVLFFSC